MFLSLDLVHCREQFFDVIAESGIDRISVGALTHSAVVLDVALDWTG
jgi:nicotinate-nucleotide pyrophosphorylase